MAAFNRDVRVVSAALILFVVALFIIFQTSGQPVKTTGEQVVQETNKSDASQPAVARTATTAAAARRTLAGTTGSNTTSRIRLQPRATSTLVTPEMEAAAATSGTTTPARTELRTAPATDGQQTYTVQSGDTVDKILKNLHIPNTAQNKEKVKVLNGLDKNFSLKIGQTLKLPKP